MGIAAALCRKSELELRLLATVSYTHLDVYKRQTVYGALTKGFSIAKGDRLALTAGYYFPLNDHSIKDGPFGGISYSRCV